MIKIQLRLEKSMNARTVSCDLPPTEMRSARSQLDHLVYKFNVLSRNGALDNEIQLSLCLKQAPTNSYHSIQTAKN